MLAARLRSALQSVLKSGFCCSVLCNASGGAFGQAVAALQCTARVAGALCGIAVLPQGSWHRDSTEPSSRCLCSASLLAPSRGSGSGCESDIGAVAVVLRGKLGPVVPLLCHFRFLLNCSPPSSVLPLHAVCGVWKKV